MHSDLRPGRHEAVNTASQDKCARGKAVRLFQTRLASGFAPIARLAAQGRIRTWIEVCSRDGDIETANAYQFPHE